MVGFSPLTASVVVGSLAALLLAAGMLASAYWPGRRFWPPGRYDRRWWTYIALSGVATAGLILTGYLDWNSWILPRPESFVLGLVLLVAGIAGFIAATFGLGVEESSGKEGDLQTDGFYRYTRNPQILFLFLINVGSVSVANSVAVLVVGTSMAMWFALMPIAEEPWLQQQYGVKYERYRESTPRFIDGKTVRSLLRGIGGFNGR